MWASKIINVIGERDLIIFVVRYECSDKNIDALEENIEIKYVEDKVLKEYELEVKDIVKKRLQELNSFLNLVKTLKERLIDA